MPAATPHTATRKTRSQSPPRRTQRTPVIQMQAAIPSRSISPYAWIAIGPSSSCPLPGDGIEARAALTAWILPARGAACLEQDLQRDLGGASALVEADGRVQVDVVPARELARGRHAVSGAFELLASPFLDAVELRALFGLSRRHRRSSILSHDGHSVERNSRFSVYRVRARVHQGFTCGGAAGRAP